MKDTAWVLYNVLMKRVENNTSNFIKFKDFDIIYSVYDDINTNKQDKSINLAYYKKGHLLHKTTLCSNILGMNNLFIQNETIKNILMAYIEKALSTLTEKEITEIFNSYYGEQAIHV